MDKPADRITKEKMKEYYDCHLCPRDCGINRNKAGGACGVGSTLKVSLASLHMWEEPCISGTKGSGTVFFSGCSLKCVYCQNQAISRGKSGKLISPERLVEIFFELKEKGANNINLVTADHYLPAIAASIEDAKRQGIGIPFLLNTSSYVHVDTLRMMEGLIDIYLPDMKYIRNTDAERYSKAADYPDVAKAAIAEMVRQQPECVFFDEVPGNNSENDHLVKADGKDTDKQLISNEDPGNKAKKILRKGVIVRHLLLPGQLIQAKMIVRYLYNTYGDKIYISLMSQYTPDHRVLGDKYPEISRRVSEYEYRSLIRYASEIGVTRGFIQEGEAADESFIPEFDCRGV